MWSWCIGGGDSVDNHRLCAGPWWTWTNWIDEVKLTMECIIVLWKVTEGKHHGKERTSWWQYKDKTSMHPRKTREFGGLCNLNSFPAVSSSTERLSRSIIQARPGQAGPGGAKLRLSASTVCSHSRLKACGLGLVTSMYTCAHFQPVGRTETGQEVQSGWEIMRWPGSWAELPGMHGDTSGTFWSCGF